MNMNHLLTINKSGINGLQKKLDITAANIANVNTVGYKKNDTTFTELLHNANTPDEVRIANTATNQSVNRGVAVSNQSINFIQGSLSSTTSSWDMAIDGEGFFGVRDANNQLYLTRAGNFQRDAQGYLRTNEGLQVEVEETIPQNQWPNGDASVSANGVIIIQSNGQSVTVGRVILYKPENNENLRSVGNNLYQAVDGQELIQSTNQQEAFGRIHNYQLENANVNLADSMTDLIVSQRAYSINLKALETSDEMSSVINRFTE
ncbi:flagellar hook-basal body protein [Enterococcus italicus]|uniref:flagellar hook-basal body protein n=1 Tax=Enterococcus italicus TaxID=246144 RepID=UPI0020730021|nr:flagellar hook basal-body protein [Enterococcus italicus]